MATTDGSGRNEVRIEWTGPIAREDAHRILDSIGVEHLKTLRIGIATDQSTDIPGELLPASSAPPEPEPPSEEQPASTAGQGTPADAHGQPESTPRLQGDSDSFNLLRLLRSEGGWLRTKDLRDAIPERWDINEENIGSVLWNLTERNLVEKRPFEPDKRETEYRVTTLGETALDEAFHRAESSEDVETEPLPEEPPGADD
jgi:DNA-binding HxlR family transcriptional regulator